MRTIHRRPVVLAGALVGLILFAGGSEAAEFWKMLLPATEPMKAVHREKPQTGSDAAIEQLAAQIDWLEHNIDEYGTVVAKHPDVWGESRLTRHREEYEKEMAKQLSAFQVRMQGSLARSDQAFLGFSMAIQAAAGKTESGSRRTPPTSTDIGTMATTLNVAVPSTNEATQQVINRTAPFALGRDTSGFNFGTTTLSLEPNVVLDEMSNYIQHLQQLRRINEGDDTKDAPGYALDLVRIPVSVVPGKKTREGYGAEITITAEPYLTPELLPTTFRSLVVNDLVDLLAPALTYWVNDKEIRRLAHEMLQAEQAKAVTIAAKKHSDEAAATVKKQYDKAAADAKEHSDAAANSAKVAAAAKEQADEAAKSAQAAATTTKQQYDEAARLAKAATVAKEQSEAAANSAKAAAATSKMHYDAAPKSAKAAAKSAQAAAATAKERYSEATSSAEKAAATAKEHYNEAANLAEKAAAAEKRYQEGAIAAKKQDDEAAKSAQAAATARQRDDEAAKSAQAAATASENQDKEAAGTARSFVSGLRVPVIVSTPGTKNRRAYMPIPPSQIVEVFGERMIGRMICEAYHALSLHPVNRETIHAMDVRAFLSEEVHAAYLFLAPECQRPIGDQQGMSVPMNDHGQPVFVVPPGFWPHCTPSLAGTIRERKMWEVFNLRNGYLGNVNVNGPPKTMGSRGKCRCVELSERPDAPAPGTAPPAEFVPLDPRNEAGYPVCKTLTAALGWGLLVESALLNDQLNQDYREALITKGSACPAEQRFDFYGPDPLPAARQAFLDYVRCRWPVRVFALDPVTDQQNIADMFSRRRELQIALAMAFAGGQMNAQSMMRYTRRLEWDMATIALNQTAVAFSHGDDTFGWRFYPRFQTPPIKGNLATMCETWIGGPTTDQDLRTRQLEPGMRECVAIVVMPSFVPYVTFDTRANFFKLTNPKSTEISMRQTMVLSRSIKAMKDSAAQCAACAQFYRDGEVERLLKRVHQLDRALPLQTMQVQLPYENTAGGFELFNRGVTDLAPQLVGWYGSPGIDPRGGTTLFLVGKSFSVHGTQVTTGGRLAENRLLSRQVMEVSVPPGVEIVSDQEANQFVDVHVATAYGVTDHLLVPVAPDAAILPGGSKSDLVFVPNQWLSFSYKLEGEKAPFKAIFSEIFRASSGYFAISAPPLSVLPTKIKVTLHLTDVHGTYVKAVSGNEFTMNPQTGQYCMLADALAAAMKTPLSDYLNGIAKEKDPGGPVQFTVVGQAVITDAPAIPIGSGFDIEVTR